ncbi:MAG: hypothetical protein ACQER7_12435 [Bacteroidota bacterium]
MLIKGEEKARMTVQGSVSYSNQSECRLGMVSAPEKPSDIHRPWGTVASYFGIDGIIDEVKVYDQELRKEDIGAKYADHTRNPPDIKPRRLPDIEDHPGRFGAFYTKLNYYPGWDELSPVAEDPDVVVCFDQSPVKMIFWRGLRYGPAWVSENNNWMADQSVENWNGDHARVLLNGKESHDYRTGINHELEGDDLVLFLFLKSHEPVSITITDE